MHGGNSRGQRTHLSVSEELGGKGEKIESGKSSQVVLKTSPQMGMDEKGLVHGGYTFALADYAAMVAVNAPLCGPSLLPASIFAAGHHGGRSDGPGPGDRSGR
jgi:acyl-coenzyme A thioesterase PaaI-like protein